MPNIINQMIVRDLTSAFTGSEGMIFVSLSGLTVKETEGLRDGLAEQGVQLRMLRNRLATLALKEQGFDAPTGLFSGNVACCCGSAEEAIHAAKVLHTSPERKAGKVTLRGGVFEGNLIDENDAVALAALPSRDELRAKLLGTIAAPMQQLVGLLAAPGGAIARVLQARVDADGSPGEDA